MAQRTGSFDLILHPGNAPAWLIARMKNLAEGIFTVMVEEFGLNEVLIRLSDPLWFQALSCTLAFDWDSSGTTTVTCGVLKDVFNRVDLGVKGAGGKGGRSREVLKEIEVIGEKFNISTNRLNQLKYASRITAKVDNAAIQAGYQIYHHSFFASEKGDWVVVQQGLNAETKTARRFHWLSHNVKSFVDEPHTGIVSQMIHKNVLDMTAHESESCRRTCTDIVNENPDKVKRQYLSIRSCTQSSLAQWIEEDLCQETIVHYKFIPENINWKALRQAYETKPRNFEEILSAKGVGPATVRGLALVAELIYGQKPSWKDPVKYSFAFGGKDGIPFPVDRRTMDKSIEILKQAVENAKVGDREKISALQRLRKFVPPDYVK
jgi:hypothetical protein